MNISMFDSCKIRSEVIDELVSSGDNSVVVHADAL